MSLLIPGTNSIKDTGYDVANSLRFESAYLQNPSSGASSSAERKTLTWSIWLKRSELGATGSTQYLASGRESSGNYYIGILFNSSDQLRVIQSAGGSTQMDLKTNRVFRDVSAWYHIVVAFDTTQGTSSNRVKIYVNGTQETSFATETYPSQDLATYFGMTNSGDGYPTYIGSNTSAHFSGYMAEVVEVGGSQLTPTSFGEFDSDTPTVWKPKDLSDLSFGSTAGANVYLDFEDSSDLGNDISGGNNDYSLNSIAATDQSTDTCTNNFCTMNSSYPDGSITFSEGNLKLTQSSSSWRSAGGTIAVSTGKWYWETKTTGDYTFVGFADIQLFNEGCSVRESFTTGATTAATAFSLRNNDPRIHSVNTSGAQTVISDSTYSASAFTSATIGIALNLDDNEASWYINGTVQNSGTPLSISAGTYVPGISIYATNLELNFGSPPYSISSGNADANGFGNFEYAVPSGYFALCTKNLAEFG